MKGMRRQERGEVSEKNKEIRQELGGRLNEKNRKK